MVIPKTWCAREVTRRVWFICGCRFIFRVRNGRVKKSHFCVYDGRKVGTKDECVPKPNFSVRQFAFEDYVSRLCKKSKKENLHTEES